MSHLYTCLTFGRDFRHARMADLPLRMSRRGMRCAVENPLAQNLGKGGWE